ncbi:CoA transferase [Nocardiopsis sp. JB363]|uniref:CoA transferase n=1 Tax=Nocardiopsis sp. JB363 TaxID=1434837 RepID=UPI001F43E338|nr:CoA transferase [Nocardiopsis sp. JB363]
MDVITTRVRAAPLAGTPAWAVGDTVPVRVAASRLRELGCAIERVGETSLAPGSAGRIDLLTDPAGPTLGCDIGWSTPSVPLRDERDVQAACGLAHLHGRSRGEDRFLPIDYASVCAGVLAAQAVMATVLTLERGGPALRGSVSVAGAALTAIAHYVAPATATPGTPFVAHAGQAPPFGSSDGVRFEIETLDPEAWLRFWETLGAPMEVIATGWAPFQRRFATAVCPLPRALFDILAARPFALVRDVARECAVGVVPVRAPEDNTDEGPTSPWRLRGLDATPGEPLPPWPDTGTGPLAGLRLVEATNRVQGPLAGLLLTLMGADTVRIEPPGGDPMRGVPPLAGGVSARFAAFNRGKDAIECDLRTAEGRGAAGDLAARGHVLLYNWPPGRAERFGLGVDDLTARAPGLVHVHADGWAGEEPDPGAPATDFSVQAHGGIADLLVDGDAEPAPSLITLTDVLGAFLAAEAALAGLLLRTRTGVGVAGRTALVDAARLLRRAGRGTAHLAKGGTPAVARPETVAGTFPEAFTREHGVALPRAPWTFTPLEGPPGGEARR